MSKSIYKLIPDWLKIIIFKIGGGRPWSKGYSTFKFQYIRKAINNQKTIKRFRDSEVLPKNYGYALDERAVEYPWVVSKIPFISSNFLDAGSTLNIKEVLEHQIFKNKKITIVNLNPEPSCFYQKGISYFFGDIRELPFKDNYFDFITCISTLEHIGMDNYLYTNNLKNSEEKILDFEKAILELKRVLKSGGSLFITVPFGKYKNFGWFQQFDSKLVNRVLEVFGSKEQKINYYKYGEGGWNISDEKESRDVEYFDVFKTKYFEKKSIIGFDFDLAAASRAVVCLELVKN